MRKPAVACGTMPELCVCRNCDNGTRRHRNGLLTRFLIPAPSAYTDEKLSAAGFCMMNMPVVAASRFERYVVHRKRRGGNFGKITVPRKVLCIRSIRFADRKENRILILLFCAQCRYRFVPYILCQAER